MQFKTISHAYEESDRLADLRQDGLIADADYYPAIAEVNCWLNEFEIAERIAYFNTSPGDYLDRLLAEAAS